jgi:hypothetical protein
MKYNISSDPETTKDIDILLLSFIKDGEKSVVTEINMPCAKRFVKASPSYRAFIFKLEVWPPYFGKYEEEEEEETFELYEQVSEMLEECDNKLKEHVLNDLIEYCDDEGKDMVESRLNDLSHGCSTGIVSELIYYRDTYAFFDEFIEEIQELKEEWEDSTGEPLNIGSDIRNSLAWFGYEAMVSNITYELGL